MKNLSAHISLLLCNLIWACAFPIYNFMMPTYIKPLPMLTATLIFTGLVSLTSLFFRKPSDQRIEREDILKIIFASLLIAVLRKGLLMGGLSLTSPIDGSIISTITPVVVLVVSILVGFEGFSRRKSLGVLLGFGGALGVILTGSGNGGDAGALGNIMILLCAFISAIYMVWFKSLLQRYSPLTILRWMFCIAAIAIIPFGIEPLMKVDTTHWNTHIWLAFAYLVIMPTYIPNLLLTSALKKVQPTVTSIYTYVQPLVAVTISVTMGLAKLHPLTILFGAMIFVGVGVVITKGKES